MRKPLKILHVTTSVGVGGAENMLSDVIERMAGSSFESVVVTTMSNVDGSCAEKIRRHVSALYDLNVTSFRNLSTLLKIRRIIRHEKPDVVQTWMHKADLIGGMLARLAGVRNVVWGIHSRDVYASAGDGRLKLETFRRLLGMAAKVLPKRIVSCSRVAIDDHERQFGYPSKKMHWIGNGVDTDRFQPNAQAGAKLRKELAIPVDAPVVGFVGRFDRIKDVPTFLQAAALLMRTNSDVHFVLCGDEIEPVDPAIHKTLDAIKDRHRLHVLPFRSDIENVYPAFTICSLTSKSEAYPMVLLEAMACQVPCVATDTGDSKAIIGDTGSVVPIGQPTEVAKAWNSFLDMRPTDLAALGHAARERVCSQFGLSSCVQKYAELYNEITSA